MFFNRLQEKATKSPVCLEPGNWFNCSSDLENSFHGYCYVESLRKLSGSACCSKHPP